MSPVHPRAMRDPWRLTALMVLVSLAAALTLQGYLDHSFRRRRVENLLYLPNGRLLKTLVLDFDSVAADYYWLRTIGYFGGHFMADKKYPWLGHMLELVTDLDPRLGVAYYFGGIVLAMEVKDVPASNHILLKGMVNLPDNWKYPFFLGFNYFFHDGDLPLAAWYLERASLLPGRPEYLLKLVASLYARAGMTENAITFLNTVLETVEEEHVRQGIRQKIEDLRAGNLPQGLERILTDKGSF
jgi:hypothetical protein